MNIHGKINEPPQQRYTFNVAPEDVSSNDPQPYPLVIGTQRVPLTWIGQLWDAWVFPSLGYSPGGKKGGGSFFIDGWFYFGSFAGVAGYGPASALVEVIVDGASVWKPETPVQRADSANPYQFTIPNVGEVYFYWGTDDQTLTDNTLTPTGRSQPPYRSRVLVVCERWLLGLEKTSVPDVQVVYERAADQDVIAGAVAGLSDGQVNPLAAAAEALTHPTSGLGIPASRIDATAWLATAETLHEAASSNYISMFLGQKMRLEELLEEISGYVDVWWRINDQGQISVGSWGTGAEPADLPVISMHDLTAPPDLQSHGYAELDDRVTVSYRDRSRAYADAEVRYDTPLNRGIAETSSGADTSRRWITRPDQAASLAVSIGVRRSSPWLSLRLSVREARVLSLGLHPGAQFVCDYEPLALRAVCRVLAVNGFSDKGGAVRIGAESERGLGPPTYTPTVISIDPEGDADIEDLVYLDFLQATTEIGGGTYRVIALAGRHQPAIRSADVWWRQDDSTDFTRLIAIDPSGGQDPNRPGIRTFAVPVELTAAYADTEPLVDTSGALTVQERSTVVAVESITDLDASQSAEQISDDHLLLFLLDGDGGYEVMTIRSIETPTGGVYPLHVNRARLGTSRLSHDDAAIGYIIERSALSLLYSGSFSSLAVAATTAGRTIHLKAPPSSAAASLDLVDASEAALTLEEQVILGIEQVAIPVPSISGGEQPYGSFPISVSLTVSTDSAVLRWSKVSVPNSATEGTAYTGAISVDADDTIYAKAFKPGMLPSSALIATYTEAPEP